MKEKFCRVISHFLHSRDHGIQLFLTRHFYHVAWLSIGDPGGGGGYCHIWAIEIWAIEVGAAVKGMVFKPFTLG